MNSLSSLHLLKALPKQQPMNLSIINEVDLIKPDEKPLTSEVNKIQNDSEQQDRINKDILKTLKEELK